MSGCDDAHHVERRIAILGGGMLGVCTALMLARRGKRVTLIEGAAALLDGASRWNEGKIHLGFLYAADPTLRTAVKLIPGGLAFRRLVEGLVERPIDGYTTSEDICLVHRESVVDAEGTMAYARRNLALIRDAAAANGASPYIGELADADVRALSASELACATSSPDVVAGFHVPERSISTVAIADLLCDAVRAEPRIETRTGITVTGVHRRDDGRYDIRTEPAAAAAVAVAVAVAAGHDLGTFDTVVNALWEGRPAVDASLGILPPAPWSHRFRAGLFAHAPEAAIRNVVLITGPFGDMKRYADGRVYLSWYPAGLLAQGHELEPPRCDALVDADRRKAIRNGTLDGLSGFFPAVGSLGDTRDRLDVRGGWVYALGQGSIGDPASTLHARDRFNMTIDRGYISVDTAKYSLAPWLAARVSDLIAES